MTRDITHLTLLAAFSTTENKAVLCSANGQILAVSDPMLEYSHRPSSAFIGKPLLIGKHKKSQTSQWQLDISKHYRETRLKGFASLTDDTAVFTGLNQMIIRSLKVDDEVIGYKISFENSGDFEKSLPQKAWLQLFRDTLDGTCLFDESLNILSTNIAFNQLAGTNSHNCNKIDDIIQVKGSFKNWFLNSKSLISEASIVTTKPHRSVSINVTPIDLNERQLFWCSVHDLSARLALQKKFDQTLLRFKSLFENNLDGMALASPDGIFIEANQRMADMLGVEVQDIIGRHFTYFNGPTSYELPEKTAREFVNTGYSKPFEKRLIHKNGTEFSVGVQLFPHFDSSKKFIGAWNFYRPIESDRASQLKMAYQYETLFEQAIDAISYSSFEGIIKTANKAFCELIGRPLEEIVGQSYTLFTDKKDTKLEENMYKNQLLERGYSDLYEKKFISPDGTEIPVTIRTALVRASNGAPEGVWSISRDASTRRKLIQSLAISERRFRSLFSNSIDAIGLWTTSNELQYANKAYLDLVGYSQEELRGLTYQDLTPKGWEDADALMERQIEERGYSDIVEKEVQRKDGSRIPISIRASAMKDNDGELVGSWVIIRDISAYKDTLRKLEHSQNMLEQTSRMSRVGGWELNVELMVFSLTNETYQILSIPRSYHASVKNIAKLLDTDSEKRIFSAVKKVLNGEGTQETELRLAGFTPERWIKVSAQIAYEDKDQQYAYGAVQDISDFKQQQLSLESDRDNYQQMAFHDPLTKLPNRLLLEDRFRQITNQARRDKKMVALMIIDLDDFKSVNDIHGHPAGDYLLAELANRLRQSVRSSDTVARLGGDEFVVIAMLEDQGQAETLARKLVDNVHKNIEWQEAPIHSSCSIGIALSIGYTLSFEELYANADKALYHKKKHGKDGFSFSLNSSQ